MGLGLHVGPIFKEKKRKIQYMTWRKHVYDEIITAVKNNIHVIRTKLMGAGYDEEERIVLSSCRLR